MSISILFTSCEDNDQFTGASSLKWSDVAVTLSSAQTSYTINESLIDEDNPSTYSIKITATIAQPQPINAVVSFKQASGNANSADYSVGEIVIAAGQTVGSTNVEVFKTGDIEGTETFNLQAMVDANFTINSFNLPVTISNDFVNDVLEFSTTWAGEYTFDNGPASTTIDFCTIDFDVELYTTAGDFVQYLGATGACTETGSITGLPNGDYFVVLNLYDNPNTPFAETETVPVTVSYSQANFATAGSFTNTANNLSTPAGTLTAVATVTVNGYNYTVTPM
ncbi:hypothetical protein BTO16_08280 [Polaribacter glomeratus]|uniref:Calx-beta domain-containing protein n=2 Tax=Polaribacter glomeratus TaxID=102 RepID=A0A2S7WYS9_9FLAO|nr:hypothetical protein BTO16_08280 [Polaribacter glomeratus]